MIGDDNKDDGDDVGYYYKDSCVPLAKRWSTARLDTNITLIMCGRIGRSFVSEAAWKSPANKRLKRAWVLARLRRC